MSSGKDTDPQFYLASNSPRRKELLALTKWEFKLLPSQVDETPLENEEGAEYVKRLARSKARAAASKADEHGVIIAADTAVIGRGMSGVTKIFGKPRDKSEATGMLRSLRGSTHQVHTAIAIIRSQDGRLLSDLCTTNVPMRNYHDEEIETYVASGDPLDKAGAYAIQNPGFHPVEGLQGCFANVMGLPLCHLTRSLAQIGISPHVDVPKVCQAALRYDCNIYRRVLNEKPQEAAIN